MDKKHYIKALEKVPGNPQIVINVLCNDERSEAWVRERAKQNKANAS